MEANDTPRFVDVERVAQHFMDEFIGGKVDAVYVAYMNFISAGQQKAEVAALLPLAGVTETKSDKPTAALHAETIYDFMPSAKELLDDLLPRTVKAAMFQAFLDATTSEHVARMVAMKSATDNADKMQKALTMQYNRARQSQITTELSEIMGGVEAMKA
jgi:F-type H+-transporting ATPase subunit gamma